MAIADTIDVEFYSTVFLEQLRFGTPLRNIANLTYQADLRRGAKVKIPRNTTSFAGTERSADGTITNRTYPTRVAVSADGVEFAWDKNFPLRHTILPEDERNISADMVGDVAVNQAESVQDAINTYVATKLAAVSLSAVPQSFESGAATADQDETIGTATNYLGADGEFLGTDADQSLFYDEVKKFRLKIKTDKKLGNAALRASEFFIAGHPVAIENLYGEIAKIGNEAMAVREIQGDRLQTLWGEFSVIESGHLSTVTVSSKDHYPVYIGARKGIAYADGLSGFKVIERSVNQDGDFSDLISVADYSCKVHDPRFLYRINVRAEA